MDRMDVTEEFAGIQLPGHLHTPQSLQYAQDFQFREGDVVIVTFPKSGTTWMQEILTLIYSKGDPAIAKSVPNWVRAPWLEHTYFKDTLKDEEGPRIITTHLPSDTLAPALQKSKAKVIYIVRNPKDVAVSFYYFHKMAKFLPETGSFPEFLECFLEGKVYYGSWFDHVKGWYGQKKNLDIIYLTYENMHKDLRRSIKKVCGFLGCPMYSEEVDKVEQHCRFSVMSQNVMVNYTLIPTEILDHEKSKFMRKGVVGDWKNHLTEEQNENFNRIYKEKMSDCDLQIDWSLN
ncbi:sulfotransferase 2B1-like isoform X2 [Hyla sarda]|uniref:sulfotransferase 2B1-like isoform X2 n=1 Tax=Hyla sarda TaxID=327740 RepID=UPI0024C3DDAB|nr:sulfotransferase 2B1-like isoform X2 [Hyla sarda]